MLFFLTIKAGIIVGSIGPSPLTMQECQAFVQERYEERDTAISSGLAYDGKPLPPGTTEELKKYEFDCAVLPARPKNGDRYEDVRPR